MMNTVLYCTSQYMYTKVQLYQLSSYQIKINQLHYAPVYSNRSDTSTIVPLCISLLSMHRARLDHRHMALSAPTTSAARGSAQRPNLVQLCTSTEYR